MGDRSRFPLDLCEDDVFTFIVGRINRTIPQMSDIILRYLSQLPNAPAFVSDSHQEHLKVWRTTVAAHLNDAGKDRADEIVQALRAVLSLRASVDHALTECKSDLSEATTVIRRAPHLMSAGNFRHLFTDSALPNKKEWPDHKRGIAVGYYGPQYSDANRYHEHKPLVLDTLVRMILVELPHHMAGLTEVSEEAVSNHAKNNPA